MTHVAQKIEFYGISEIGLVRADNEDIWAALPEKKFFILADGMGGHNAGEIASSLAVESMCASIQPLNDIEETCQHLREAIAQTNSKIFEASCRDPRFAGMGTTLSCFIIVKNVLIYGHVGDSRLYRYRDDLQRLTEDHSLRQTSLMRHVITRAVGTEPTVLPDIGVIPLKSKDLYMLCSDGLSDYVDDKKIARILSSPLSLEEMGRNLVEIALEKGGNDNITLLLVRIM